MFVLQEPPRTGFELAWQTFGIRFRVFPSFLIISAILAGFLIWQVVGNNPLILAIGIAIDVACILAIVLFVEYVQGLVYRSYGIRLTVVLRDFAPTIFPESEPPHPLQRIAVQMSFPAACFLCFAIVYYSNQHFEWSTTSQVASFAYFILRIASLFWGIIGLIPVFPFPSGRIMLEALNFLSAQKGLLWTLVISIFVGLAYVVYTGAVWLNRMQPIELLDGVILPPSIIVAVFFLMSVMNNYQMVPFARQLAQSRASDNHDDDQAPWERR